MSGVRYGVGLSRFFYSFVGNGFFLVILSFV